MGSRRSLRKLALALPVAGVVATFAAAPAVAQVQVTPNFSVTPSTEITPWVIWMAFGAIAGGVLILVAIVAAYLRFAPKFFGREEAPRLAPGARPALLMKEASRVGRAPVGSTRPPVAAPAGAGQAQPSGPATSPAPHAESVQAGPATAGTDVRADAASPPTTAEVRAPSEEEQVAAPETEGEVAAAEASAHPTAGPQSEPAVQADAVGEAEAAAPEPRPSAKTADEVAAPPEVEAAPEAAPAAAAPQQAPEAREAPEAAPAPSRPAEAGLDQETFDRVLEEQLARGVDRRVAEGRARAAAVVAARKKASA